MTIEEENRSHRVPAEVVAERAVPVVVLARAVPVVVLARAVPVVVLARAVPVVVLVRAVPVVVLVRAVPVVVLVRAVPVVVLVRAVPVVVLVAAGLALPRGVVVQGRATAMAGRLLVGLARVRKAADMAKVARRGRKALATALAALTGAGPVTAGREGPPLALDLGLGTIDMVMEATTTVRNASCPLGRKGYPAT